MLRASSLVSPIQFAPFSGVRSYWATHFLAMLQCLRFHKALAFPGNLFDRRTQGNWSLSDLRGTAPAHFFNQIDQQMQNFGFQYCLATLLNSPEARPLALDLIQKIEEIWNIRFSTALNQYSFRISGNDSELSADLSNYFSHIFPPMRGETAPILADVIANSDLCLVLQNSDTGQKVGIFGEVEGLHGRRIWTNGFWSRKSDYCIFGIGILSGQDRGVYLNVEEYGVGPRVLVTFEGNQFIVTDFRTALWHLCYMMHNGPNAPLSSPVGEELGFFLDLVRRNWRTPLTELIYQISGYIHSDDILDSVPGLTDTISHPRIIV